MRLLTIASLLVLAAICNADRYAILVGIDKYSFITSPTQQLRGAQTDVSMMKRMLDYFGFDTLTLLRSDATRERIVSELAKLDGRAKRGDTAVFYFSGRGSIAPSMENPSSKSGMEPTLVPFDGSPKDLNPDIRIRRLQDWAKTLDTRGVHVSIILDCSFQAPTRSDFGRQYHPVPRSVSRAVTAGGEVREELYEGPGAFLSASPAGGSAYEWLQNSAESRWSGAFTDQLVNSVVAALNRGENPSYVDAMREVQAYFKDKVRNDYMPGLAPAPDMEDLVAQQTYDEPVFGGLDPSKLPPDSKAALAAQARLQAERERKFRVAIEVMKPAEDKQRTQAYEKASKDLQSFLKDRLPNSEFAPVGAPPDVVVQLTVENNKLEAKVTGDDLDKTKPYTYTGKDLRAALGAGLADYLELRSLVSRLYRLSATETPTWQTKLGMSATPVSLARGEEFLLEVVPETEAFLFLLNRDDADGILQISFPYSGSTFSQRIAAPLRLGGTIGEDSSDGRMMLRAIVVPAQSDARIPEIDVRDDARFRTSLIRQLRAVVNAIESKRLPWTSKTTNIRIR